MARQRREPLARDEDVRGNKRRTARAAPHRWRAGAPALVAITDVDPMPQGTMVGDGEFPMIDETPPALLLRV